MRWQPLFWTLRHTLIPNVQGVWFCDFGSVKINKNQFGAAAANNKTLCDAGFGINTNVSKVQLKASVLGASVRMCRCRYLPVL